MTDSKAVVKSQTLEEVLMMEADQANLVTAYQLARQVERQKMVREASAAMAKLSWGQSLSDTTRAAVCRWALEQDIDPLRHFDILGNNVYPNARYFFDRVAHEGQLVRDEVVILAPLVSIDFSKMPVSDEQKDDLKRQAEAMNAERLMLQMEYGVPEAINKSGQKAAAALVRLYWRDGSISEGINWAGDYGQKKGDPVGADHPVKTATTRAFRKAAMKKVSVHKFAKGDDGTPIAEVTQWLDSDREECHRNRETEKTLPRFANAPHQIEPEMVAPGDASEFVDTGDEYAEEIRQEGDQEAPVSATPDAEAEDPEEAQARQEELGMKD